MYAPTFGTIEGLSVNPIDFDEIPDENLASAANAGKYSHMTGFDGYGRKSENGQSEANRVDLLRVGRQIGNPFRNSKYGVFTKSDYELKTRWRNYDAVSYSGTDGE